MEGYCHAATGQLVPEKQGKVGGDHCIVEELLDFSNEAEGDTEMAAEEDGVSEEMGGNCSADSCANSSSGGGGASHTRFADELVCRSLADVGLSGDLCEPASSTLQQRRTAAGRQRISFAHKRPCLCSNSRPRHDGKPTEQVTAWVIDRQGNNGETRLIDGLT
ncbi:hypothetical protein KFK09_025834 [Dendrobium nobile]|uniref:Uncharacterized protein n=1 Tax=Dendrobium nobile TaxID=94219 RepID=A0A8T3A6I0_DENNO|nr:hypothetical protein KFK09_025834 [Dendrobium nobile]